MKWLVFCLVLFTGIQYYAQRVDENAIRNILSRQTAAWNNGNLEEFRSDWVIIADHSS
jgi:hypothetical protein